MTMRWLCDENVPRLLVDALRQNDHDVVWIRELSPGVGDPDVLAVALRERRICLTFDKDFGELAANRILPSGSGVILVRMTVRPTTESVASVVALLNSRSDWAGHFSVLEPGRVRMRRLWMR